MGIGNEVRELGLAEEQPCGHTHIVVPGGQPLEHRKSIVRDCPTEGLGAGAVRGVSTWLKVTSLTLCPLSQGTASPSLGAERREHSPLHLLISREGVGIGTVGNISQRVLSHVVIKHIP